MSINIKDIIVTNTKNDTNNDTNSNTNNKLIMPEPSPIAISTSTIIISISGKILMQYLSRFMDVYPYNHVNLESKNGGVYSLEYIDDLPRCPPPYIKKGYDTYATLPTENPDNNKYIGYNYFKAKEFSNQTTFKFQYWGFRNINIFSFANGTLKLTGIKSENEARQIATQMIKYIQASRIYIYTSLQEFDDIEANRKLTDHPINNQEYFIFAMPNSNDNTTTNLSSSNTNRPILSTTAKGRISTKTGCNIQYFRRNLAKYLLPNVSIEKVLGKIGTDTIEGQLKTEMFQRGYYSDEFAIENINKYSEMIKQFETDIENIYNVVKKFNINETEFSYFYERLLTPAVISINTKYPKLNLHINVSKLKIDKNARALEEQKQYIYTKIYNYLDNQITQYRKNIKKEMQKFMRVRTTDIEIADKITELYNNLTTRAKSYTLADFCNEGEKPTYNIGEVSTEMINSDYSVKFNIDLQILPSILKKYMLHSEYNPVNFQGVSTKFYYNPTNKIQGICSCEKHCATIDKKSPCDKITIIFFRPGSILINGAKNTEQIRKIYDTINKIIQDNYETISYTDNDDELRKIQLCHNDERKICKKHRIFYIAKAKIKNYPFYLE